MNVVRAYQIETFFQLDPVHHRHQQNPHLYQPTRSLDFQEVQLWKAETKKLLINNLFSGYTVLKKPITTCRVQYIDIYKHVFNDYSHELHWKTLDLHNNFVAGRPSCSGISAWNNNLASLRSFFHVLGSIPLFLNSLSPSQFRSLRMLKESSLKSTRKYLHDLN